MMARKGALLREKAKRIAVDLLVIHGFNKFSINLLAEAVGTTSANLHYHFKNKISLVEEVLDEYAEDTSEKFRNVWVDQAADFSSKVRSTYELNKNRYGKFNNKKIHGRPWSLIARMRMDQEALSPKAIERLRSFSKGLIADVRIGVEMSVAKGDLCSDTPVEAITLQLASIVNSAGPITQDAGNILILEKLYEAFLETAIAAYGPREARP